MSLNKKWDDSKLVKNSLGYDSKIFIYQDKEMFNYSVDTILLGNFASLNAKVKKVLEVGTNNGALSIFLSERKNNLLIDAIEIQERACQIADLNLRINQKENQIKIIHDDFKIYSERFSKQNYDKYDLIIVNPPFYKIGATKFRQGTSSLNRATHEIDLNLEELIFFASKIIKTKGYLAIVMPVERMIDLCCEMRKNSFEPKRIQFVHPRESQKAKLVLVEGRYNVGWGTHFLPNLYLHPNNSSKHEYRKEIIRLYKPIKWGEKDEK